jgi:hypothetical protein
MSTLFRPLQPTEDQSAQLAALDQRLAELYQEEPPLLANLEERLSILLPYLEVMEQCREYVEAAEVGQQAIKVALDLGGKEAVVAQVEAKLGHLAQQQAEVDAALLAHDQALANREFFVSTDPPAHKAQVAKELDELGELYLHYGQLLNAIGVIRRALAVYQALAEASPAEYEPTLAATAHHLGDLLHRRAEFGQAAFHYQLAARTYEGLAAGAPEYGPLLAATLNNLALTHHNQHHFAPALELYQRASALYQQLAARDPAFAPLLGETWLNLGRMHADTRQREDALAAYCQALALWDQLARAGEEEYEYLYGTTAMKICHLYAELSEEGERSYHELAFPLLAEAGRRLQKHLGHLPDELRKLQRYFWATEPDPEAMPASVPTAEPAPVFAIFQRAKTTTHREVAIAMYDECIAAWALLPLDQNEDADCYAEAHLRRGQLYAQAQAQVSAKPALADFARAHELLAAQLADETTWPLLLENAYCHCRELDKEIVKGWLGNWLGKERKQQVKDLKARALQLLAGKTLPPEAQAWAQKLAEV